MFFQLLYIHLFRPFLKYNPDNSPLPPNVSPRKQCTQAAAMISKLLRLYKRSHGLRQICNICVYIAHSACTIHLLNLPEKNAKRDIIHGIKHLEEIAEGWLCARRTLGILSVLTKRWKVDLPDEAAAVLARTDEKFGPWNEVSTPKAIRAEPAAATEHPQPTSPSQPFSPSLQPYSLHIADVATPTFPTFPHPATSTSTTSYVSALPPSRRNPSSTSLPPTDLAHPTHTHAQQQHHASPHTTAHTPATPASSSHSHAAGASPSQLFGGVDQLLREGQDWMVRDQSQLASGFDNWATQNLDEIASWFAAGGQVGGMNGGPVGGGYTGNGSGSGSGNGVSGGVSNMGVDPELNGLQGFTYDERSWYDYQ